ncbi:MAG: hypothetical protein QOG80_396 [Pseudonocardiales bacterium]|jgi:hypothetical protein|nr:hypothetical protein [Pseudonocardiales bacterium]
MFHPVGSQPPSVYWRRRFALLASLVVLIALTVYVLRPGGGGNGKQHTAADRTTVHLTPTQTPPTSHATTPASSTSSSTAIRSPQGSSGSPTPTQCGASQLKIAAAVAKPSYPVGQQPVVMMQVTNTGRTSCVQDLADSQVELRVYNGESRVWGSHDCQVEPGTAPNTLMAGQSVRVTITWSGLSSQPKCAGTRQRVGAGTYTLYALLAGHEGTAATFSIS